MQHMLQRRRSCRKSLVATLLRLLLNAQVVRVSQTDIGKLVCGAVILAAAWLAVPPSLPALHHLFWLCRVMHHATRRRAKHHPIR